MSAEMNELSALTRSLAVAALLTISPEAFAADIVLAGIQVSVPDGYQQSERAVDRRGAVVFVRKGDGKGAIARLLPELNIDSSMFHDNNVAYLSIAVVERPEKLRSMSADEVQQEFTRQLGSQWGPHSFSIAVSGGIRWFINYAGAFVAVSTRVVEDKIVVVESTDFVHRLVAEKTLSAKPGESAAELWKFFRAAANADDAERVLLSARPATGVARP